MIKTLSANTADQAFSEGILPRTPGCGEHFLDPASVYSVSEIITVDSIAVPYQVLRHSIVRERFDDLLGCPFCCGMLRDIEMQHAATLMRHNNEYE